MKDYIYYVILFHINKTNIFFGKRNYIKIKRIARLG